MPNKRVMAYIRNKKIKGKTYYYIVESLREKEKIKQRVVRYLGTVENIAEKFKFWDENN